MCGGFRPSRQWLAKKEEARVRKYEALRRLQSGRDYTWPTNKGDIEARFGGHARIENLSTVWAGKIKDVVAIHAETFSERDTVSGTREPKNFYVPKGKAIYGVIIESGGARELRIVTQPADINVAKVHHRMPSFIDIDKGE